MAFESFSEFISMRGHGIYVWSAFIISISLFKILLWKPLWEQRQILKKVHQQMVREKKFRLGERNPT